MSDAKPQTRNHNHGKTSMTLTTRTLRGLCAAAAIAATSIGLAPIAGAAELAKLSTSTILTIDTAHLEAAIAQGYFKDEGIDLQVTPMVGGAAGLPALAAGQVQIASSNMISIILAAQQGLKFKIIAAGDATAATPPDLAGLVAKPGSDFKTGKALEGKQLAVNTRKDGIWLYARSWVKLTGGDPDKVIYQEVPFPQMIDAVQAGRVNAAFVVEPFLSAAVKAGTVQVMAWPYNAVLPRTPIAVFVSTPAFIDANPALIDKFVRAHNRGSDWVTQNKGDAAWVKLISSYTKIAPDKLANVGSPVFPKTVDPAQVRKIAGLMKANGLLKEDVDVNALLYRTVITPPQ